MNPRHPLPRGSAPAHCTFPARYIRKEDSIEVLRNLFVTLIVQLLDIGLLLNRSGVLAFLVEFRRQKVVVKHRNGAACAFSMDEVVRNLESAESTLLRDRIVICMTTDLPTDDTDPFAEVMAAGCPAYGTDTVVINR